MPCSNGISLNDLVQLKIVDNFLNLENFLTLNLWSIKHSKSRAWVLRETRKIDWHQPVFIHLPSWHHWNRWVSWDCKNGIGMQRRMMRMVGQPPFLALNIYSLRNAPGWSLYLRVCNVPLPCCMVFDGNKYLWEDSRASPDSGSCHSSPGWRRQCDRRILRFSPPIRSGLALIEVDTPQ